LIGGTGNRQQDLEKRKSEAIKKGGLCCVRRALATKKFNRLTSRRGNERPEGGKKAEEKKPARKEKKQQTEGGGGGKRDTEGVKWGLLEIIWVQKAKNLKEIMGEGGRLEGGPRTQRKMGSRKNAGRQGQRGDIEGKKKKGNSYWWKKRE